MQMQIPEEWSDDIKLARLYNWAPVTWVIGLWTARPESEGQRPDLLAMKLVVLPRAPVAGDQVEFAHGWVPVDYIRWRGSTRAMGQCVAHLRNSVATSELVSELEADGWEVIPGTDPDAALRQLLD
jgi:hypothetical protein